MAIPKIIIQTFKSDKLPWITRFHINRMKKKNPGWKYEFYDDRRIVEFFEKEFSQEFTDAYKSLTIGAAKADFFRYAVLYKTGGVYVDVDGYVKTSFDSFLKEEGVAVVSNEGNPGLYCQWALIFDKGHPFLKRVLEKVLDNIQKRKYPHDVHKTTGPTVFTEAVNEVLAEKPDTAHRFLGVDYEGHIRPKYKFGRIFLYGKKSEHWKKKQQTQEIIK